MVLSPDRIIQIPTLSLLSLSQQQQLALNETQLWALESATQLSVPEKLTPTKRIINQENQAGVSSADATLKEKLTFWGFSFLIFFMLLFVFVITCEVIGFEDWCEAWQEACHCAESDEEL